VPTLALRIVSPSSSRTSLGPPGTTSPRYSFTRPPLAGPSAGPAPVVQCRAWSLVPCLGLGARVGPAVPTGLLVAGWRVLLLPQAHRPAVGVDGAHQCEMAEGLREVAGHPPVRGRVLLGHEPEVVGETDEPVEH